MTKNLQTTSLRKKIFILLIGSVSFLGILLTLLTIPMLYSDLREELSEKGEFMAKHLANSAIDYLLTDQFVRLNIFISEFPISDNDAIYIYVLDKNNEIVAHTFPMGFPKDIKNINPVTGKSDVEIKPLKLGNLNVLDFGAPVMRGNLGEVHIGLSETMITDRTMEILWVILGIIVLSISIVTLIGGYMARKLTDPLKKLTDAAEKLGSGDLSARAETSGYDELGKLGSTFNQMIESLQETTVSKDDFRKQNEFLNEVLAAIPYPFYVINTNDYTIEIANPATGHKSLWGNITCHALTHKQDTPCGQNSDCICPLEKVKETGQNVIVEHIHYDDKNQKRFYEVHGYPIFDKEENLVQMIEFSIDITKRKQAEIELLESQKKLKEKNIEIEQNRAKLQDALDEISTNIMAVINLQDLQVRYDNPTLTKCYETKNCTNEDCPCYGGSAELRCWQISGTFCGEEAQGSFVDKHDTCMHCEVFLEATVDPVHRAGEYFNNMMHILQIKNSELLDAYEDLKQTHAHLLQQEKMASIGQLAAGVAHEINNPMGFITSNLNTLFKYSDKLTDYIDSITTLLASVEIEPETLKEIEKQKKKSKIDYVLKDIKDLVGESLEGAGRVVEIVRNLKSFARLDEHVMKLADMNECLESTLKIIWNEIKYKAEVIKEYGDIPQTKCFPMEINQVFMNIIINGAHAIEKQGEIRVKTSYENGNIYVAISDTGCGIPEDKLGKIFEPFYTTKEAGKGTGLGMSISYDIIKKHNGEIKVDSKVGEGTTFTIVLPVVEE